MKRDFSWGQSKMVKLLSLGPESISKVCNPLHSMIFKLSRNWKFETIEDTVSLDWKPTDFRKRVLTKKVDELGWSVRLWWFSPNCQSNCFWNSCLPVDNSMWSLLLAAMVAKRILVLPLPKWYWSLRGCLNGSSSSKWVKNSEIAVTAASVVPCCTKTVFHRLAHLVERKLVCSADSEGRKEMIRPRISFGKLLSKSNVFSSMNSCCKMRVVLAD